MTVIIYGVILGLTRILVTKTQSEEADDMKRVDIYTIKMVKESGKTYDLDKTFVSSP